MIDFYNVFLSPSSGSRARLSVHLHARGGGELDLKVTDLLRTSGLDDVPKEKRQSLDALGSCLEEKAGMSRSERESIISQAKSLGLSQTSATAEQGARQGKASAMESAQVITDVRQYKAGLVASQGARPVKELGEFEESDAKL